jgi:hypothetical protein
MSSSAGAPLPRRAAVGSLPLQRLRPAHTTTDPTSGSGPARHAVRAPRPLERATAGSRLDCASAPTLAAAVDKPVDNVWTGCGLSCAQPGPHGALWSPVEYQKCCPQRTSSSPQFPPHRQTRRHRDALHFSTVSTAPTVIEDSFPPWREPHPPRSAHLPSNPFPPPRRHAKRVAQRPYRVCS